MKYSFTSTLLLIIGLLFASQYTSAQIEKGTIRIGPDMTFISQNLEVDNIGDTEASQFNLDLNAGYFVVNNLEIGLGLSYMTTEVEEFESNEFGIGPQARYLVQVSDDLFIPLGIGAEYSSISDDSGGEASGFNVGFGAGMEYIVDNKLGAILGLEYGFGTLEEDTTNLEYDLSGFTLTFGSNFYF